MKFTIFLFLLTSVYSLCNLKNYKIEENVLTGCENNLEIGQSCVYSLTNNDDGTFIVTEDNNRVTSQTVKCLEGDILHPKFLAAGKNCYVYSQITNIETTSMYNHCFSNKQEKIEADLNVRELCKTKFSGLFYKQMAVICPDKHMFIGTKDNYGILECKDEQVYLEKTNYILPYEKWWCIEQPSGIDDYIFLILFSLLLIAAFFSIKCKNYASKLKKKL